MKKNKNILQRVEHYKYKRGINFADTDSSLYRGFKIAATLAFIWFVAFNLLYIFAEVVMMALGQMKFSSIQSTFLPVAICTAVIITGYILIHTRLKLWGCFACLPALLCNIVVFYNTVSNAGGSGEVVDTTNYFLNMPPYFYYRHLVPSVLLLIPLVILIIIDVRYRVKTNKLYNHIVEELYKQNKAGEAEITDDEWSDFLDNYNPSGYKNQF